MSRGEGAPAPGGRVRRLSGTEAGFAHRHALLSGSGLITTSFTVADALPPERVERAVAQWVRRLPLLSLRIEDTGGGLWFRHGTPGPYPVHVLPRPAPVACRGGDGAADAGIPGAGERLWRLRVGRGAAGGTRFALTCHPSICDPYSAGRLARFLLDALFGAPGAVDAPAPEEPLPPDTDELTYEGGGVCGCGVCLPRGWPHRGRRAAPPYADVRAGGPRRPYRRGGTGIGPAGDQAGREGGAVILPLTPGESRRLRDWCGERHLTVGGLLTSRLAGALAGTTGRGEVTVARAMSLRRRYAERALISEPGCVLGVVRASLRTRPGGDPAVRAREDAALLCSAGRAWRPEGPEGPEGPGHPGAHRAAEQEAGTTGSPELRVVDAGSVDTALGAHAARVTAFWASGGRGGGPAGCTLHLSTFKGVLTVSLASQGLGADWPGAALRSTGLWEALGTVS
ncbi:hypothetical protein [Streptomyces sp. WMMC940]|uniref:hypothetical protein n=1 Tax=Streptomyces sp. WMMC940 TaxID=3015153 RepID=UPI0022B69AC1|nr:hypothetical protein [Streptomyces sp. WMMC940]MCZ7458931.1 hypothetical protein [Streptomyces sp. WMMC940]